MKVSGFSIYSRETLALVDAELIRAGHAMAAMGSGLVARFRKNTEDSFVTQASVYHGTTLIADIQMSRRGWSDVVWLASGRFFPEKKQRRYGCFFQHQWMAKDLLDDLLKAIEPFVRGKSRSEQIQFEAAEDYNRLSEGTLGSADWRVIQKHEAALLQMFNDGAIDMAKMDPEDAQAVLGLVACAAPYQEKFLAKNMAAWLVQVGTKAQMELEGLAKE
jgi:hypothetical protein